MPKRVPKAIDAVLLFYLFGIPNLIGASFLSRLLGHACKPQLAAAAQKNELLALSALYRARLREKNGRSMENRLKMLEEFTENPLLVEATGRNEYEARSVLDEICAHYGNVPFANKAISLLKKLSGPAVENIRIELELDIPPAGLEKASSFPPDAFQKAQLSPDAEKKLIEFYSGDETLEPDNVTRRIYAFMSENSALGHDEKINFLDHLISTYQEFQRQKQRDLEDIFYSKKLIDSSGNYIYCAEMCSFYFVIDKDGHFYSARNMMGVSDNSEAEALRDWRATASFIFKAGTDGDLKQLQTP